MTMRLGVVGSLALLLLAGAATQPRAAPPACVPSTVHYAPPAGLAPSLRSLPWVGGAPASQRLVGLLWYWPADWRQRHLRQATIYTHGHLPAGEPNTKILWAFLAPAAKHVTDAGELVVKGRRLDGPGRSWQKFVAIGYAGQNGSPSYASIIDLPAAGCWQLDLRAGSLRASTLFRAVNR